MWDGWSVLKCDPVSGKIIGSIKLPDANVTSCIFGGKDMDTLYITTAKAELTEEEKRQQKYAGGLFEAKVGTSGFPCNRFGNR
jgi:sugar lactone lactonase YvrE